MAKGKRYSEDQILSVLKEIDNGATIASVARAHGITDQTLYRWRERYAGMHKSVLVELKALQEENAGKLAGTSPCPIAQGAVRRPS